MNKDTADQPPDIAGPGRLISRRTAREDVQMAAFVRYWDRCRVGADVPRRADIDPRGIESLLSNAFVLERIASGAARMRIAGSHLADLMGMEVRGMPLSAFIAPADRDALGSYLVRMFDEPATVRLNLTSRGSLGSSALSGTLLLLPLRSDLGDISRALGCLVATGPIGKTPRRFEIDDSLVTPLDIGTRPAKPDDAPGLREDPAPFTPRLRAERPYLRLVPDDE